MSSKKMPNIAGEIDAPGWTASTEITVEACWPWMRGETGTSRIASMAKDLGNIGVVSILIAWGGHNGEIDLERPDRVVRIQKMPCPMRDLRDFHRRFDNG
jgi:hypothetical protein